jgi:hypothetical protein
MASQTGVYIDVSGYKLVKGDVATLNSDGSPSSSSKDYIVSIAHQPFDPSDEGPILPEV